MVLQSSISTGNSAASQTAWNEQGWVERSDNGTCTHDGICRMESIWVSLSSCRPKNIPLHMRPKSPAYSPPSRPKRGAYRDRHGRGAGCGGRGGAIDEQR